MLRTCILVAICNIAHEASAHAVLRAESDNIVQAFHWIDNGATLQCTSLSRPTVLTEPVKSISAANVTSLMSIVDPTPMP